MMNWIRTGLLAAAASCWALSAAAETPEENLIHATFKIYNKASTGTGFLLRDPSPTATPTNVILITAAHAFKKASDDSVLLVCRTEGAEGWKRFDHKIMIRNGTNELWTAHPTQDVAVIRCTLPPDVKFSALPLTSIAREADAQAAGLTVGSRLFYFGFPFQTEANKAAFPLFREALVTAYPLFPVATYPTLFITSPTFAGDSGAPVALRLQQNTSIPLVVGIVISRTQQNDKFSNDDWTIHFKRDMNLGSFVQAEYIHETLKLLDRGPQP